MQEIPGKSQMAWRQGDQMSLWKIAQNVAQPIFQQNEYITFPYIQWNK
jgi:hypothetical protein